MIKFIIIHGSETWMLIEERKQNVLVFERRIIRKIIGSMKELNELWKMKPIMEYTK